MFYWKDIILHHTISIILIVGNLLFKILVSYNFKCKQVKLIGTQCNL